MAIGYHKRLRVQKTNTWHSSSIPSELSPKSNRLPNKGLIGLLSPSGAAPATTIGVEAALSALRARPFMGDRAQKSERKVFTLQTMISGRV